MGISEVTLTNKHTELAQLGVTASMFAYYLYLLFICSLPDVKQDSGVSPPEATLEPGHSAQLHTAVINQSSLDLHLLNYLGQNWSSKYRSEEKSHLL